MVPFSLTLNIPLSRFWWQRISSDKRMNLLTSGSWSFSYPSTSCDHISAPPRFLRGGGNNYMSCSPNSVQNTHDNHKKCFLAYIYVTCVLVAGTSSQSEG